MPTGIYERKPRGPYKSCKKRPAIDRFLEKFEIDTETGCHNFTGSKNKWGYGSFWLNGKWKLAHRASYELFRGPVPDDVYVCHICDNPGCVNPDHLFLGTQTDNMRDMYKKGRGNKAKGEKVKLAKLTADIARKIRQLYELRGYYNTCKLAEMFGVTNATIGKIVNYKTWKHV